MSNSKRKTKKFSFSKLDLSLSVHMQSAVLLPPDSDNIGESISLVLWLLCSLCLPKSRVFGLNYNELFIRSSHRRIRFQKF